MKTILVTILLFNQMTWATPCPEAVQFFEQDTITNCTGYLYSPEADKRANDIYEEWESFKNTNVLLEKRSSLVQERNQILERRLQLHIEQGEILARQLVKKENGSKWEKALFFTLGILATGVAVGAAKRF